MRLVFAAAGIVLAALGLWSPARADAPSAEVRFVSLSDTGPAFLAYDGGPTFDRRARDWPVVLVFAGGATVGKVKTGLRRLGFTRRGEARYLAYRRPGASPRFDGDRGLKTACDRAGTDVHLRLYAPADRDRFDDPEFGRFVVATAHLDRADGCGTPPRLFGFSELAEERIAASVRKLGWEVRPDHLDLRNAEPYRRDISDPAHVWLNDGRATLVTLR